MVFFGKASTSLDKGLANSKNKVLVAFATVMLSACGGGGGESSSPPPPPPPPPPPANEAPVANAGEDMSVAELTVVTLSGSASDADDETDTLSVSWVQTGGTPVTLDVADSLTPSFTAPDVTAPELLTFDLTVTDPDGLSDTDSIDVTVQEPLPMVTISGILQYEFVPPKNNCNGLDYNAVESRPIRQATVQLLDDETKNVLDSAVSDDLGQYSVTVDASTDVIIRVRAESVRAGNPSWNVQVRNNVDTDSPPAPLDERPIYVMDSSVIDSGVANQTLNLTATTGWGGSSYTEARVSGPFAILDVIYDSMLLITDVDPNVNFGAMDAFWSPDNSLTNGDIALGELGTSFYNGNRQLFLVGLDGEDTDEFDDHIVAHEWTHFFEDNLARSDSTGGPHGGGDSLDMRLAFGEGFANAMSAMILDNPVYCDTNGANNNSGFDIDMEQDYGYREGWFNESSVEELVYDLWDTNSDGDDNDSVGFAPIYDVMVGPQATTPAFTSIFSFATYLKDQGTGKNSFINSLLLAEDITSDVDIWGSMETNAGALAGVSADVLPVYTDLTLGNTTNICVNSGYDGFGDGNKLAEKRYLKLDLASNSAVTFEMIANPAPTDDTGEEFDDGSDPDVYVFQNGQYIAWGESATADSETINPGSGSTNSAVYAPSSYTAGTYVVEISDWRMVDAEIPAEYPERVCFDFTAN